jgi:ferredoxin
MGAGVMLACAGAGLPEGAEGAWLPILLPCLSIVTASWFASPLAAGAPAVGIRGCGTSCDLGGSASAERAAGFVRDALVAAGVRDAFSRVRVDLGPGDPSVWGEPPGEGLSKGGAFPGLVEPASTVAALSRIMRSSGTQDPVRISSLGSPLGVARIDADGCTLCGLCAGSCPTSALAMDEGPESLALVFDAGACIACENCVKVCPENVVVAARAPALAAARSQPAVVKRGVMRRCRRCGKPVAPEAMLGRLEALLDDASPQLLDSIRDLCLDCRQLGRGASAPVPM